MARVKSELVRDRHLDLAREDAFGERAAGLILQHLCDASEFVYKTGDSRIGCSNHWPACLNAAKNRICQMLTRTARAQKPCVVRYIHEQIRAFEDELAHQISNRVFKTDQRRDADIIIGEAKYGVIPAEIEIAGHPFACDSGEKGKRMPQGNIFAKWHEMHFAINLHLLRGARNQECRVIIMSIVRIERAEQQIGFR